MGKAKDARRQLMGSGSGVVGGAGEDGNYSAVSRKLMASMGWSKGKGLGKDEQGIDEHLKARKREDNVGLGADSSVSGIVRTLRAKASFFSLRDYDAQVDAAAQAAAMQLEGILAS